MSVIDQTELFERYYQTQYDFNTTSLSQTEIAAIKRLAKEKRHEYGIAPLGTEVFDWILSQNRHIQFEPVSFDSEKIDGMLYIPSTGEERAYIVLNANKPLVNQVFTAAHEYYHYIMDYRRFQESPYICDFSMLKDVNEKKASRFAAELLLPEDALHNEIKNYCLNSGMAGSTEKSLDFLDYSAISIFLTVKYQIPLKAVIYRLAEEKYIDRVDDFIENYAFIKSVLKEIKLFGKRVEELYGTENNYVIPDSFTYKNMERAFLTGKATREDILNDSKKLGLDMNLVTDFLREDAAVDQDDDDELFSIINRMRR